MADKTINVEATIKKAKERSVGKNGNSRGSVYRARRRLRLLQFYDFACRKCKSKNDLTIHHIEGTKKSKGGVRKLSALNFSPKNCEVLCVKCHNEKDKIYQKSTIL